MRRFVLVCVAVALVIVVLAVPVSALATEATLTEVVEATKAVQTEVAGVRKESEKANGELLAVKAQTLAAEGYLNELHTEMIGLSAGVKELTEHFEAGVKEGQLKVSCTSGCSGGGGGGGEVELTKASKEVIGDNANTMHDDFWFLIGTLFAIAAAFVLYSEWRPRA